MKKSAKIKVPTKSPHYKNIKGLPFLANPLKNWCRLVDSNYRPTHYECVALPTELNRHCFVI